MTAATINSKGQVTIPLEVRNQLVVNPAKAVSIEDMNRAIATQPGFSR
jgi:bifunctional DNA-binding transcriptional regulator/antitoxin component of YhaV-PrlF toxin-antitoxin module